MSKERVSYRNPPLVEVIVSLVFDPIRSCPEAHFGAFWSRIRNRFPRVRAVQPVPPRIVSPKAFWVPDQLRFAISHHPEFRLQMISEDDQWVCQLQRDRMIFNWRKRGGEYPRYEALRDKALEIWADWRDFCDEYKVGKCTPSGWEVTYINFISESDVTGGLQNIVQVFPSLLSNTGLLSETNKFVGLQSRFVWEAASGGELFVDISPHTDESDRNAFVLNITSNGKIADQPNVGDAWDTGHEEITSCFEAIVSNESKAKWGIE